MRKARRTGASGQGLLGRAVPWLLLGGFACLAGVNSAQAFNIDTGVPDLKLRWDNTVKYSAAFRVENRDKKIEASSYNPNLDDGDRNFDKGLISNRLDVLSELDASFKGYGVRLSGAGWYDSVYNRGNDNNSPFTANQHPYDEFPDDTRDLHGRKMELLDAFVYGKTDLWENGALSLRLGRYTLLYGESLFLGANGIAAAQAPIDVIKALSVPNSQFKEIGMPVPQVSGQLQILPGLSLGGYYQFKWVKSRLPASGSYFSFADMVDDGGERILFGPPLMPGGAPQAFYRGSDVQARDSGQFGAQVKLKPSWGDSEYGLYAARYHSKEPVLNIRPAVGAGPQTPLTGQIGDYVLLYPEKIWVYGASMSTTVGDANLSGEVSYRHNTPLAAIGGLVITAPMDTSPDGDKNAPYPVGDTFHAQMSMIKLFSATPLWGGASVVGEVAYNRRMKVTQNENQLDPNSTRDAMGLRMVFEPQYFQVLPRLDITVPIGLGYAPFGRSCLGPSIFGPEHGGDLNIGITGEFAKVWKAGINFTHYFGPRGALVNNEGQGEYKYKQLWGDRDYISVSVQRTF